MKSFNFGGLAIGPTNIFCEILEVLACFCEFCYVTSILFVTNIFFTSYLGVFGLLILGSIAVQIYRTIIYALGSIRAARVIHNKLIASVVGSTFR